MPEKKPYSDFHVGQAIWHKCSYFKDAWRCGTVTKIDDSSAWGNLTYAPEHIKRLCHCWGGREHDITPRAVVPIVPKGTIYLISTKLGQHLAERLSGRFEVYEAGTRMQTKGQLLGYVILPASITTCTKYYTNPAYQMWSCAPSVYELLSFLGAKLPEILEVSKQLK